MGKHRNEKTVFTDNQVGFWSAATRLDSATANNKERLPIQCIVLVRLQCVALAWQII